MFKGLNPTSDILSINLGKLKAAGLEQSAEGPEQTQEIHIYFLILFQL
jgi:hypothetical protein